jgi:amino acid transporter
MYLKKLDLKIMSAIIGYAVIAMASVLLVFQMGQPRIWMSMSRDGLLPKQASQRGTQNTKRHHMQQLLPVL